MNRVILYMLASALLLPFNSCIKEDLEECPVQFTVKVFVEDKQYINIDDVPQLGKKDESLPFRDFVGTLYYTLKNRETGATTLASSFVPVIESAPYYTININDVPEGMYDLTVWGNVTQDALAGILHREHVELTDLYLGSISVNLKPALQSAEVKLNRAKGNLVVLCNNFPSNITQLEQDVSSVYQAVEPVTLLTKAEDVPFKYSGEDNVSKKTTVQPLNQFFLAPTVSGKTSKVSLHFYDPNDSSAAGSLRLPDIDVSISRNKISLISVDYKKETQSVEIWTSIDGKWTLIHKLGI